MNVVYHCQAAGIKSVVVSAIGNDPLGKEIIQQVEQRNISTDYIQIDKDHPTGTVSVELEDGIPDFTIHKDVAWDYLQWNKSLIELAREIDAVAFGSLAQRDPVSRENIQRFLKEMRPQSLRVFDINLRQNYYSKELICKALEIASILKINDEELLVLSSILEIRGSVYDQIRRIMNDFDLELTAFTKGSQGSVIYTQDLASARIAPEVEVKDTVGAGDTFTAVLIAGLLNNKPIEEIHKEASDTAAWVCTKQGGTPPY